MKKKFSEGRHQETVEPEQIKPETEIEKTTTFLTESLGDEKTNLPVGQMLDLRQVDPAEYKKARKAHHIKKLLSQIFKDTSIFCAGLATASAVDQAAAQTPNSAQATEQNKFLQKKIEIKYGEPGDTTFVTYDRNGELVEIKAIKNYNLGDNHYSTKDIWGFTNLLSDHDKKFRINPSLHKFNSEYDTRRTNGALIKNTETATKEIKNTPSGKPYLVVDTKMNSEEFKNKQSEAATSNHVKNIILKDDSPCSIKFIDGAAGENPKTIIADGKWDKIIIEKKNQQWEKTEDNKKFTSYSAFENNWPMMQEDIVLNDEGLVAERTVTRGEFSKQLPHSSPRETTKRYTYEYSPGNKLVTKKIYNQHNRLSGIEILSTDAPELQGLSHDIPQEAKEFVK